MKVGIKGKGEDIKWVDVDDLMLNSNITLGTYKTSVAGEISGLKSTISEQAIIIAQLRDEIKAVKLENIKIVEGLLRR